MRCEEANRLIEAIAGGEEPPDAALHEHVATCQRCTSRLAMARAIESLLATRETPEPPPRFTAAVMTRIGRERWRTEQMIDAGFNLAVAFGLLLIIGGVGGIGWVFGLFGADSALVPVLSTATMQLTDRLLPHAQTVIVASLLLFSALGLWWWAEEGFA